ncbi:DNA cytosine methyltransferase [Cerasicoccus arenae]|uniref:DNA (cytosine-5-)-methyltransferase n=1 Tax=Cerasicoccus arenae TaxID=424488 RepID=A0A8J3DHF4_9BACT|nr:DNA cytosine methyltransferase [Cerasicoccus arenae]MBK1859080.1 DNA cytosine methyltransferase [Cerasicoccus arenae]GHC07665.1 DNA (cytosine-5-)-methyltransferase [Cerasicoccus arenae]
MTHHLFYEFFAGGGMARMGLGPHWRPLFANDCDAKKNAAYRLNWGADELLDSRPVQDVATADLPGQADLAWASFPCQDLSLAGGGAGLAGARSGSFWGFWNLMQRLGAEGRAPHLIVLENVAGALTSHCGQDFAALAKALSSGGYRFGALLIDTVHYLPQSRPRLFLVAVRRDAKIPSALVLEEAQMPFHPPALQLAYANIDSTDRQHWVWWRLPAPAARGIDLADAIEDEPSGVTWHSAEETEHLLVLMDAKNRAKVTLAQERGGGVVGTIYRRTRMGEGGQRRQRAEVRFDGVAGCLRTPGGGSSRQTVVFIDGPSVRTRLLSVREAARLMGLPDSYKLPKRYNEGYHLIGDGVAVPVVRHLAQDLLEPLLSVLPVRSICSPSTAPAG